MKKTLFAALALVSMVSCSNEEVVEMAQKEAIGFDKAFIDKSTRAYDPSYTQTNMFKDFTVYGFVEGAALFNGIKVSKSIDNGDLKSEWKYEGTQYWIPAAKYNFCAIAPTTGAKWTKTSCSVLTDATSISTTLSFENTGSQDLLYAENPQITALEENNGTVGFIFKHLLSRIKFSFQNLYDASGATIRVENIKIENAYKNGSVNLKLDENGQENAINATWTPTTGTENLVLNFGNALSTSATTADAKETIALNETKESYNALFLIPNGTPTYTDGEKTVTSYKVTFDVVIVIDNKDIKKYSHITALNFKPEAGKSYDILAVIKPENINPEQEQEPIEFTVTSITGWGDDNNVNMNETYVNNSNN